MGVGHTCWHKMIYGGLLPSCPRSMPLESSPFPFSQRFIRVQLLHISKNGTPTVLAELDGALPPERPPPSSSSSLPPPTSDRTAGPWRLLAASQPDASGISAAHAVCLGNRGRQYLGWPADCGDYMIIGNTGEATKCRYVIVVELNI